MRVGGKEMSEKELTLTGNLQTEGKANEIAAGS